MFAKLLNFFSPVYTSIFGNQMRIVRMAGGMWHLSTCGIYYSGSYIEKMWREAFSAFRELNFEPSTVLILGQGMGSSSFVAKKMWEHADITGVDIDPLIVDLGRGFYGRFPNVFITDARMFLEQSREKFDLIIVDLFDSNRHAQIVRSPEFIGAIVPRLNGKGYVLVNVNRDR